MSRGDGERVCRVILHPRRHLAKGSGDSELNVISSTNREIALTLCNSDQPSE